MSTEPLAHIARSSPPWRQPTHTECGRQLNDTAKVISREEALALVKEHGQQRAAFLLCMTCCTTGDRYAGVTWEQSPSNVVARDGNASKWKTEPTEMDRELFAIAALVEAHRDEFDGYLADLDSTVSLTERRAAKRAAASWRKGAS